MLFFNQTLHISGSVTLPLSYKHNLLDMELFPWEIPYNLHLAKLKSVYKKGIKSADVMGVVQHHVYFPFEHDNIVKIKILGKNKVLRVSYSGHLDEKNDVLNNIFRYIFLLIWMI